MRAYHLAAPRIALALIATAMSALTLGILVILPAGLELGGDRGAMLAAISARAGQAGIRSHELAAAHCLDAAPASRQGDAATAAKVERS
jgi:hypothetical protein